MKRVMRFEATSMFTIDVVDFALLYLLAQSHTPRSIVTITLRSRDLLN